ncbi:MAG TPA: bacterial transcriptional activator domain-containing protein [Thermoleophilaceae bacterium]
MSAPDAPRLVVVYPRDLVGENAGLYGLHVTSLVELLVPLGWRVEAYSVLDPRFPAAALGADLTIIQMLADPEAEALILRRRDMGLPTVYEVTDNVLGVGDWVSRAHPVRSPLARQSLLYHAHLADATQMLVPALAELFAAVNPRAIVLSPRTPFPDEPPPKPPGFVFGWSGSRSHSASLAAAAPAVIELCRRHPEATFAFMGDRRVFDEHFAAIAPEQRRVHPFSEWDAQLRFVGGLNVGIAPMAPSPFNATRSDTRVGLYAGHGVAAVLEDAPAHRPHRAHARIYRTTAELLDVLEELFHDREQVEALARAGRAWIERERSAAALGAERDSAYRELLAPSPNGRPARADEAPVAGALELTERLYRAHREEPERALAACRELVAEHPAYDQAQLLAARCLERLGRHEEALAHAERVDPSPVYSDLFAELRARAAAHVRPAERARHAGAIRSPFRRARLGEFASPAEQGRAVLEHNPYDHFALVSTIRRIERRDGDSPELAALYERLCMVAPEDVPPARRPARLAAFLPA